MIGKKSPILSQLQDKQTWVFALKLAWVAIQIILVLIFATGDQVFYYQDF